MGTRACETSLHSASDGNQGMGDALDTESASGENQGVGDALDGFVSEDVDNVLGTA